MRKSFFFVSLFTVSTKTFHKCIELSNFIFASVWLVCTNETKTLRKREASGIKTKATNDRIHLNRYLLISGFIASSILSIHLRACSPMHSHKSAQRCEFDNNFIPLVNFQRNPRNDRNHMKFNTNLSTHSENNEHKTVELIYLFPAVRRVI